MAPSLLAAEVAPPVAPAEPLTQLMAVGALSLE